MREAISLAIGEAIGEAMGVHGELDLIASSSSISRASSSEPAATSSPCSSDQGGVRSLCGRRGKNLIREAISDHQRHSEALAGLGRCGRRRKNHAKSSHGRSKAARLTVEAKMAGGIWGLSHVPPLYLLHSFIHEYLMREAISRHHPRVPDERGHRRQSMNISGSGLPRREGPLQRLP